MRLAQITIYGDRSIQLADALHMQGDLAHDESSASVTCAVLEGLELPADKPAAAVRLLPHCVVNMQTCMPC